MKIYNEIELREMISNLRLVKEIANDYELQDKSELDLTTYELLLESFIKKENINEFDEWIDNLAKKNGTTEY
jgi:hypothetical protein